MAQTPNSLRILFTIAHFFNPDGDGKYGSVRKDPQPRIQALTGSLSSIHQLFGNSQVAASYDKLVIMPANQNPTYKVDIVICTTQGLHILNQLPLPSELYQHHSTSVESMLLGFECQAVLKDYLGEYDYYCFLEDDLILHDPLFFLKLNWFNREAGYIAKKGIVRTNARKLVVQHPINFHIVQ